MSASLVGSEMCIRDRSSLEDLTRRPTGWLIVAGRAWDMRTNMAALRVSVSYTHLTLPTICSV
eukprot:3845645-Alexandrium_andersonii.AAC.1